MESSRSRWLCLVLACLLLNTTTITFASDVESDDFVAEAQSSCYGGKDAYSCIKYRTLRYVRNLADGDTWPLKVGTYENGTLNFVDGEDGARTFRLVQIRDAPVDEGAKTVGFLGDARQANGDSELDKFIKFGKRLTTKLLETNGITVPLPEGARAVDYDVDDDETTDRSSGLDREGRGKKKKLAVLMPLLSLLSLFKVKLLLVPILLSVLFIKKMLVLAALFLPSVLSTLKVCKMPHMPQMGHGHGQWDGTGADYSAAGYGGGGGYGGAGGGGYASGNGAYSKDWAASRAYGAYRPLQDTTNNAKAYKTLADAAANNYVYPPSAVGQL